MNDFLACKGLAFGYRKGELNLAGIGIEVRKGKITGLLGHNGSGKTTLLKLLAGLLPAERGEVFYKGRLLTDTNMNEYYESTGLLIESPVLYDHLSVKDNLTIHRLYRGLSIRDVEKACEVTGASDFLLKKAGSLSTGMRQRAGLAAALIHDPELLILDEPTNGLDPDGIIGVRELLLRLKEEGKTILLSSHILTEMQRMCDHLIILRQGNKVFDGDRKKVAAFRDLEELYVSLQKESHE